MVTVTFVKIGYIGTTTLVDGLLDERSSRTDLTMRIVSCSVSMDVEDSEEVANIASEIESDLYVIVSPNAGLPGPKKAREVLVATGKPVIILSDEPSRKAMRALPEDIGYIVIAGDPMISAKTAFLDAVEMAYFNSDVLKTLAVTGVFRLIHTELDKVIAAIGSGETPELPRILINKTKALAASDIQNPYAYGKAMAAFEASRQVAKLSTEGVFRIQDRDEALPVLTAAHELMRSAAMLAEEAREIEKTNDTAIRLAHFKRGDLRKKVKLHDKYEKTS